jgi:ERCC4-type nuclease
MIRRVMRSWKKMSASKKRRNVTMVVNDPDLARVLTPGKPPTGPAGHAVNWLLEGKEPFGVPIRYKKRGDAIPSMIDGEGGCITILKGPSTIQPSTTPPKRACDILVASGESALLSRLNLLKMIGALPEDTHVNHAPLICGDIAIVDRTTREVAWIGERKDKNDFVASIVDGRHRTQQAVMLAQNMRHDRICYVVEGNLLKVKRAVNQKAIIGALIYPLIRYKFNTIMVDDTAETAVLIAAIHAQLEEADEDKFNAREKIAIANTLNGGPKKAALCDADRFSMILTRVPDVSDDIADGIAAVHGSFARMIGAFRVNNDPMLLQDIPVKGKKDNRRVGPAASRKIYEYFDIGAILGQLVAGGGQSAKKKRPADHDDFDP